MIQLGHACIFCFSYLTPLWGFDTLQMMWRDGVSCTRIWQTRPPWQTGHYRFLTLHKWLCCPTSARFQGSMLQQSRYDVWDRSLRPNYIWMKLKQRHNIFHMMGWNIEVTIYPDMKLFLRHKLCLIFIRLLSCSWSVIKCYIMEWAELSFGWVNHKTWTSLLSTSICDISILGSPIYISKLGHHSLLPFLHNSTLRTRSSLLKIRWFNQGY